MRKNRKKVVKMHKKNKAENTKLCKSVAKIGKLLKNKKNIA